MRSHKERSSSDEARLERMTIRRATKEDIRACMAIDPSFVTDHVWQIKERTRGSETVMTFQQARLPRPIRVEYPRPVSDLASDLSQHECFLVAEEGEELVGFVDILVVNQRLTGWVKHLIVAEPHRRQGLGARLLRAAEEWCEYYQMRWIMAECQTKNYPALSIYQRQGLIFCGYNDMYYANKDIALFFSKDLHQ